MHIRHDPEAQRFIAENGVRQGVLDYLILDDGSLDLRHTFVLEDHRGRGIATGLVHCALGHALATDRKVVPTCPFVANLMAGDPAFSGLRADRSGGGVRESTRYPQYAIEPAWA